MIFMLAIALLLLAYVAGKTALKSRNPTVTFYCGLSAFLSTSIAAILIVTTWLD